MAKGTISGTTDLNHESPSILNRVAILDAGGQYVDLVHKAVLRQGIPADVLPLNTPLEKISKDYTAVIISGSPASSHREEAPQPDPAVWNSALPILGICYGMQSMVTSQGGAVAKDAIREDGRVTTTIDTSHPVFEGVKKDFTALFTHGDFVKTLPEGYEVIGSHKLSSGSTAYSAIAKGNKVGVQFHPEVFDDTPGGYQVIKNFLVNIAQLKPDKDFRAKQLRQVISAKQEEIKTQVNDRHVIAFVSGGVDSSVAATLASKVVPEERLHAFFIDNGFIRDEDEQVIQVLKQAGIPVKRVDAIKDFELASVEINGQTTGPLLNITDPETKRQIIGKAFIDIQNKLIANLQLKEALLLQGTNAADRIESGHSKGDRLTMTIKTHHNQVKEVQELKEQGLLLEPLDDLFKDEVRELGRELGLPEDLVERQPFPGPGLAIRIICAEESKPITEPKSEQTDIQKFVNQQTPGAKAHLLPIRSVGVGGDERSHLSVVAIEGNLNANQLATLGTDLPAHFKNQVNRVIYALGQTNLDKHSVTKTLLTADVRKQLRQADLIVFEAMRHSDLLTKIKQFPVVLLPLSFNKENERSIVLRPVTTSTFMTVQAMLPERDLPKEFLETVTERILKEVPDISQVFIDLTNKPPATTEWE
jgi:GMP synthase (glutamine-hydrolysing)